MSAHLFPANNQLRANAGGTVAATEATSGAGLSHELRRSGRVESGPVNATVEQQRAIPAEDVTRRVAAMQEVALLTLGLNPS